MAQDRVKQFLSQVAAATGEMCGVVASNYAREFSKELVEVWAKLIIDGIMNGEFDLKALADSTVDRRSRNPDALNYSTPLAETGLLLESLVFEIRVDPLTKYHTILIYFEDETEHRTKKTVAEIAMIHEYGIGVPARPFFAQSLSRIGFEEHRIFNETFDEAQMYLAQGYSGQGVTRRENAGYSINAFERAAQTGKNEVLESNLKGKIFRSGTHFEFNWV